MMAEQGEGRLPVYQRARLGSAGMASLQRHGGYYRPLVDGDYEYEAAHVKKRVPFCKTWCEYWFVCGRHKISCLLFNLLLVVSAVILILLVSLGGPMNCHPLYGSSIFCFLLSSLAIVLACVCCCYHFTKDDDDFPFALFCCAYCLLVLFIGIAIAGTVMVFQNIDVVTNGYYVNSTSVKPRPGDNISGGDGVVNNAFTTTTSTDSVDGTTSDDIDGGAGDDITRSYLVYCSLTELPLLVVLLTYVLGIGIVLTAFFACIFAFGKNSKANQHYYVT